MNYGAAAPHKPLTHMNIFIHSVAPVGEQPKSDVPANCCFNFMSSLAEGADVVQSFLCMIPTAFSKKMFNPTADLPPSALGTLSRYFPGTTGTVRSADYIRSVRLHARNKSSTFQRISIFHIDELKTGDTLRLKQDKYNGRFIRRPTCVSVFHLEHNALCIYWSEKHFQESSKKNYTHFMLNTLFQ
jgi:hypothetical protein